MPEHLYRLALYWCTDAGAPLVGCPAHGRSAPPGPPPPCRVIYLEDNDIVHMKGGEYTVYNWSDVDSPSVEVRRTIQTLTMEVSQIMKVGGGSSAWLAGWLRAGHGSCGQCMAGWRAGGLRAVHGSRLAAPNHVASTRACWARSAAVARWFGVGCVTNSRLRLPANRACLVHVPFLVRAGRLHALHGEGDL